MELAVFLLFATLALVSALVVVMHRNPVTSVMSLVVTLFSVAVLFVLLGAPFLAALQILVYTGAILVLFLFVIMLLNIGREESSRRGLSLQKVGAVASALAFAGAVVLILWRQDIGAALPAVTADDVALQPLARELLGTYLLPFEAVGLLLLAAVIAGTMLAQKPAGPDRGSDS